MKASIAEQLGHAEIILPSLVGQGLEANDRAKVRMSALQAVAQHAQDALADAPDLTFECRAAAIDATEIRSVILAARPAGSGAVAADGLGKLIHALCDDIEMMIRAVQAGNVSAGQTATERWLRIRKETEIANDRIEKDQIEKLIAISMDERDSLHRLVMDLHKTLNRLAAACADEIVDGAHTHGLKPEDKPIVTAFMRGVNRTRGLKFDHPGLDTTVTRRGTTLVIENDIGTTDAHVLIVTIEGTVTNVTHTDVHRSRAKFFTALFDRFPVQWSGLEQRKSQKLTDEAFFLVTGRYDGQTAEHRDAFLEGVGAALVFLIDWNKARKELRSMLDNADAVRVLDWAARRQIGHRAFLELGGADLVASAVRHAAPARVGFGERLGAVLGREAALDFLKAVLRTSTEALLEGRSVRLVRDEIEADLVRHFERTDSTLLAFVIRQAGLAHEIAARIGDHVREKQAGHTADGAGLAARARRIEEKADRLVIEARNAIERFDACQQIGQMIDALEGAIDELEQAAFVASLLPAQLEPEILNLLADLCAAVVASTEAISSGADAAGEVPEGHRADFEDALTATTRIAHLEHSADDAERAVTALVLRSELDSRTTISTLELARALERSSDRLAVAGNLLRGYAMAELSA